jgi:hypothetical protein
MTIKWHGDAMMARVRQGAMRGVVEGIGIVERKAIDLILNTSKSGRVYRRRGVEHQASAPGEPPASDQGTLVNARRIDLIPERVAARLTFTAKHAAYLQFGTRRMKPRPWADRAVRETEGEVSAAILGEVRASLQ